MGFMKTMFASAAGCALFHNREAIGKGIKFVAEALTEKMMKDNIGGFKDKVEQKVADKIAEDPNLSAVEKDELKKEFDALMEMLKSGQMPE